MAKLGYPRVKVISGRDTIFYVLHPDKLVRVISGQGQGEACHITEMALPQSERAALANLLAAPGCSAPTIEWGEQKTYGEEVKGEQKELILWSCWNDMFLTTNPEGINVSLQNDLYEQKVGMNLTPGDVDKLIDFLVAWRNRND